MERQTSLLTSLSPAYLTGDGAMQAQLPMPPVYMFSNGGMRPMQVQQQTITNMPPQVKHVVAPPQPVQQQAPKKQAKQSPPKKKEETAEDIEKSLRQYLDEKKGVADAKQMTSLFPIMNAEKKQLAREVYLQVLTNTSKTASLSK
jgi:hypothetical protein